jgi:hypothetical protein
MHEVERRVTPVEGDLLFGRPSGSQSVIRTFGIEMLAAVRERSTHFPTDGFWTRNGDLDPTPYFSDPAIWRQIGDSDTLNAQAIVGAEKCLLPLPSKIVSAPEFHMTSTRRCAVPPS